MTDTTKPSTTGRRAVGVGMLVVGVATLTILLSPRVGSTQRMPSASARVDLERDLRRIERQGGFPRDGFDDIVVPVQTDLPYREIVDPARYVPGSVSAGNTSHGSLVRGARIPESGSHHYVVDAHRGRVTRYGTDELVGLLLDTAEQLAELYPGTRLPLGNMSLRDGGDIRWSVSHNSGRDADIAFLMEDEAGNPVPPDDLLRVSSSLEARYRRGLRFDVERNWAVIEALLRSDEAQVQWVFVYEPLKQALLEWAREAGVDPGIIAAADMVMRQPSGAAPHDDHFHVRVYCSDQDRLEGCINWGPVHPFVRLDEGAVQRRVRELVRGLMDPDEDIASRCIEFLERLEPREAALTIARAVPHQQPSVQIRLMQLLKRVHAWGVTGPIVPIAAAGGTDEVRDTAFDLLGSLADPDSAPALFDLIERNAQEGTGVRGVALSSALALRNMVAPEAIPRAVDALEHPSAEVRAAVERFLRINTITRPPEDLSGQARREWWQHWARENASRSRDELLSAGMLSAGYNYGANPDPGDVAVLIDALQDERDEIAWSADRLLSAIDGRWTPAEGWTTAHRVAFWREHFEDELAR